MPTLGVGMLAVALGKHGTGHRRGAVVIQV
jgi:hypothetical protein